MIDDAGKVRWQRLSVLFDRALELEPGVRDAFLNAECATDPALRDELARMLAAADDDSAFDAGALHVAAPVLSGTLDEDGHDDIGKVIGPWQLQRLLGRGGMGEVYLAHREGESGQRAALKRLRRHWDGSRQAQRFEQERRILASLSHANIPALIDHGHDGGGRPWFALEYVDGTTLTEWADQKRLDLRARLDLFRQACAAVQHAHEHFVVHRDLKPANILVDGEGRVRVLDFGVAKFIDDSTAGATCTGLAAGFTPEYAAPEQISGGMVSAATDVHALGVILYQLLSGQLPYVFEGNDLRSMAEAISTRPAPRLEQAVTTGDANEVERRLELRATDLRGFRRFVRGDLWRILQTALAKEPQRRYPSVQRFSDDLRSFLQGRAVSVGGDSFVYHAGKYITRNKLAVGMATLAVLALLGGTAFSIHRAEQERQQRERSQRVLTYFRDLFVGDAPSGGYGTQLTAVQLLERGVERIDGAFPDDPLGKAELMAVVAEAYLRLGLWQQAENWSRRALEQAHPYRDQQPQMYVNNLITLTTVLGRGLSPSTAEQNRTESAELIGRELPFVRVRAPQLVPKLLQQRARAYANLPGQNQRAADDVREALALLEAAGAEPSAMLMRAHTDMAIIEDDPADKLAWLDKAGEVGKRASDIPPIQHNDLQVDRGGVLFLLSRYEEALATTEDAVARRDALIGGAHRDALIIHRFLAQYYEQLGRYDEALGHIDGVVERANASPNVAPEIVAFYRFVHAKLLLYGGRYEQALPVARESSAALHAHYSERFVIRARAQWVLGETLLRMDRCSEAGPLLDAVIKETSAQTQPDGRNDLAEALDSQGRCHLLHGNARQDDVAEAERLFKQAAQVYAKVLDNPQDPRVLRSRIHALWAAHVQGTPAALEQMHVVRDQLAESLAGRWPQALTETDRLLAALPAQPLPPGFHGLTPLSPL